MSSQYKIIYSGSLNAGTDPEQFVRRFMELFKVPEANARKLITVGHAVTLKTKLEKEQADKLCEAMAGLGMQVHVEVMASEAGESHPAPATAPAARPAGGAGPRCPKCGSDRVNGDDCFACGVIISRFKEKQAKLAAEAAAKAEAEAAAAAANPYTPPRADVAPAAVPGEGPRRVPAGNAWRWIADGWDHFRSNPGSWILAMIVWIILLMVMAFIPFVGSLASNILAPVFMAGFLIGAHAQTNGGSFEVNHLFAGFSERLGPLALVGVLYLAGMLAIIFVAALVFGGTLMAMKGLPVQPSDMDVGTMIAGFAGVILLVMALMIPLMMAYWFAPALVALGGMSPVEAMKASFVACLKNTIPFLLYGLLLTILFIVAIIPLGLGLLILGPVITASIYTSYRDIFPQPENG